jgi:hypothetical protein
VRSVLTHRARDSRGGLRSSFPFGSVRATRQTIQFVADVCLSALGCGYPMAVRPRRIVADVLLMSTLKFGDPIQIFVQVKGDNFSGLTLKFALRLHVRTDSTASDPCYARLERRRG